jgi:hypothetical protein
MPIAAGAARYGMQAIGNMAGQFLGGKMGETIGGYNENASDEHREAAKRLNVDAATYARVAEDVNNAGQRSGSQTSRADQAFGNQMAQSNVRANATTRMALNDQEIAANQATQLANAYGDAQARQAQTSANLMSSIVNNAQRW